MAEQYDNITAGVEGADELMATLRALPGATQQAALNGMFELADTQFMPYLKDVEVPFEFGILADSGDVTLEGDRVIIEFGAPGSGAETYAVEQHERLDFHHPIQGRAKYLEVPLVEWADRFIAAAGEAVRNVLVVGVGEWGRQVVVSDFPLQPTLFQQFMSGMQSGSIKAAPARPSMTPRLIKKVK